MLYEVPGGGGAEGAGVVVLTIWVSEGGLLTRFGIVGSERGSAVGNEADD
jgi:hypothetical protein